MTLALPDRYAYRRLLGEGGMGQVHLAFDHERGEEIALKTLIDTAEESRFLFKQEFWAMASLAHANLVAAYDYGELPGGVPYLTMELVAGRDLDPSQAQSEEAVRRWLPGIAAALSFLHGRGFVHGDLKPENIRVGDDGSVKLMDLGLLERSGRSGGPIRGSLYYVAPEVARQGAVDGRSDLYALGGVLYHVLTGRPPFAAHDALGLLRSHLETTPEPPPGLSREMTEAVMRLLQKDPANRFARPGDLLAAIGLAGSEEGYVGLLGSPIVGRDVVQAGIADVLSAAGKRLWLVGGAGTGKTRLLAEARAQAQLAGVTPLQVAGQAVDAPPYQAVRPLLKALTATPSPTRDRVAPILARVLPEIGVPAAAPLEGSQERLRLHAAVGDLARAVAPQAVWLVDDADALDPASRELLTFLAAAEAGPDTAWRWLHAAVEAPEDVPDMRTLDALGEVHVATMAAAMLGQDAAPAGVAPRLMTITGGMPGMVEAVLGHWTRSGALMRVEGHWVAGADDAFALPGGLEVVLDARFAALGEDTRRVGQTAAVLGARGHLPWLAGLLGLGELAFFAALAELEAAEVLVREDSTFRFLRPDQAVALAAAWPADEVKALHTRAARWLEAHLPTEGASLAQQMDLARHHLAGETPAAAVPWVRLATARASEMYALGPLEPTLRRTLDLPDVAVLDRLSLQGHLVNLCRFQGKVDEAQVLVEQHLLPAMRKSDHPELAGYLVTLGVIHQMKGKYPLALAAFAEAINMADAADDALTGVRARAFAGRVAFFSGETGAAKTHLASAVRRARESEGASFKLMLAGALSLYGYVLASTDVTQVAEGLALLSESIDINNELGNLYELHEALNNQGNVYLAASRLAEAQHAFDQCLALCERMGTANETVFAHLNLGAVELERGRLASAQTHARRALDMSRRQGRKFPEGFALALDGFAGILQGDLAGGGERVSAGLAVAREINNRYLELSLMVYWIEALAHLGRFTEAEGAIAKARELAEAIQNEEQTAKLDRLEASLAVLTWNPIAGEQLSRLLESTRTQQQTIGLAHALRWQGERLVREQQPEIAATLLEEAAGLAAAAGLWLLDADIAYARAQLCLEDDPQGATILFQAGLDRSREAGYRLGEILCQSGLGQSDPTARLARQEAPRRLDAMLGGLTPAARQEYLAYPERNAVARQTLAEIDPLSSDRLANLTDMIAAITSQRDMESVMALALEALVNIAGAERGFLLLYKGFEVTQQVFHGMTEGDAFSSSLAYQVLWSGEPIFVEDAQSHHGFAAAKSVQSLALRSVVCVPLHDGEETIGVMMADSQRINTRFTTQDLDLSMALARQVAITIGNTRRLKRYRNAYTEHELLHRVALGMVGQTTRDAVLGAVAMEILPLCEADRVFLLEGEELRCTASRTQGGGAVAGNAPGASRSVGRWVYDNAEPLHLVDAQNDETFQAAKSVMALGLRTIYAVPLKWQGLCLGVLYVDRERMLDENPTALHTLARVGDLLAAFLARQQ